MYVWNGGQVVWMETDASAEFIEYCLSFYGRGEIYARFFMGGNGVSREAIEAAAQKVRGYAARADYDFCGDSTDREYVREILRDAERKAVEASDADAVMAFLHGGPTPEQVAALTDDEVDAVFVRGCL